MFAFLSAVRAAVWHCCRSAFAALPLLCMLVGGSAPGVVLRLWLVPGRVFVWSSAVAVAALLLAALAFRGGRLRVLSFLCVSAAGLLAGLSAPWPPSALVVAVAAGATLLLGVVVVLFALGIALLRGVLRFVALAVCLGAVILACRSLPVACCWGLAFVSLRVGDQLLDQRTWAAGRPFVATAAWYRPAWPSVQARAIYLDEIRPVLDRMNCEQPVDRDELVKVRNRARSAAALDRRWVLPVLATGVVSADLGDDKVAEAAYRTAIRLRPRWGLAHFNLAMLHFRQKKSYLGLPALRKAVRYDPADPLFHYAYADHLLALHQQDEGHKEIMIAYRGLQRGQTAREPHFYITCFRIAALLHGLKCLPEATQSYERVIALSSSDYRLRAYWMLTSVYYERRDFRNAARCWHQLAKCTDADLASSYAKISRQGGNPRVQVESALVLCDMEEALRTGRGCCLDLARNEKQILDHPSQLYKYPSATAKLTLQINNTSAYTLKGFVVRQVHWMSPSCFTKGAFR